MQVFVTINEDGMKINAEVNVKKIVDKGIFDKGYFWNPSNCNCQCDKSCKIGKFSDYKNCKCREKNN